MTRCKVRPKGTEGQRGIIKEANIQGAPDFVVEILPYSSREWNQVTERPIYGRYSVRELWIADPDGRTLEVTSHTGRELMAVQVYPLGTTLESRCPTALN